MNREIKFRYWEKPGKLMYYSDNYSDLEEFWSYAKHEWTIPMQFTGLKDKNGKEIYSGDLLKYENNDKTFEVKWAKEGFWECDGSCLGNVLRDLEIKMEVVGNIFEKQLGILKDKDNE